MKRHPTRHSLALAVLLLLPALAATARAGLPPLIPRTLLFANPERVNAHISPDGTRLAYLRPDTSNILQVWVKTLGKDDDRQVTHDPKRDILDQDWTWGGNNLYYLQDNGGDENFHLLVSDVETGETRDMTPIVGVRAEVIATDRDHPDQMVVALNRRDRRLMEPWLLDLKTGALTRLADNPGTVRTWIVDADLQARARVLVRPADGSSELEVRDGADAPWRTAASWGTDEDLRPLVFSKDGKTLYVMSNLGTDTQGLYAMDVATGKTALLASDPSADAGDVLVDPATHAPQAVSFDRLRAAWKVLDPSIEADLAGLAKLAPGDIELTARDLADKHWVVKYDSDLGVVDYYLWDRDAKQGTFLFNAQPRLKDYTLAPMKPIEIRARDGLSMPCYLTLPAGVPAKRLPMVLLVHGGPWWRDRWGFDPESQWLANRGYAVLKVNYRGSIGFGKKYLNLARKQFAGKMHDDLIDAVNWAAKQGYADTKRVGIMGWSYGGYATLVGLSFTPDVFACGVDGVGPSNLVTLIESFPDYWKPRLAARWYPFVGDPSNPADRADLLARSPLTHADRIKAPLLVGQGANDPRVKQKESDQIVAALRARGVPVEYLVFPDEGHGFVRPENNFKFYGAADAFLAKYLGGRSEAAAAPAAN